MPASLLTDMNSHGGGLEDQRALQIALELSILGLNTDEEGSSNALNQPFDEAHKMKKSANMTECVPVPSSEHVAEIVGRQGCKIKALRAKTNTYIKTPVRGEEPVFVVTGRKEDVGAAKREILSAAEHFSQIRATRRNNNNGQNGSLAPGPPSPSTPGQVTIQVRVPYRVVGLVVGPKGATIKRIQQQTHTYIVTPSRDKEPVFEVTGAPDNVEKARAEIESHIAMRTGAGLVDSNTGGHNHNSPGTVGPDDPVSDFHTNGIETGFHDLNNDLMSSIYKPPSTNSAFTSYTNNSALNSNNILAQHSRNQDTNIFTFPTMNGSSNKISDFAGLTNGFTTNGFGLYDSDEGIASPSFDAAHTPLAPSVWPDIPENRSHLPVFNNTSSSNGTITFSRRSSSMGNTTPRLSPTLTDASSASNSSEHTAVRRIRSDPLSGGLSAMSAFAPLPQGNFATSSSASIPSSTSTSPTDSTGSLRGRRNCFVCAEGDVVAALVPCGHNLFCMECANLIVEKAESERLCPVCHQISTQAIRIFS